VIFLPIIIIISTALVSRSILGSWLSPGSFFALCWSFFLIMPLVFAPSYNVDLRGIWFIVIFSMACASGSVIASKPFLNTKINFNSTFINYYNLKTSFFIISFISIFGLYLLYNYALFKYNFGYYSLTWLSIPNLIAIDRYNDELTYPLLIKYSLYFIYPANLLGGLLFSLEKSKLKSKIIFLLPLFLAFFLGVLEGARSGILLGLIIFFSSWLSTFIPNSLNKSEKRSYIKLGIAFISLIMIFTLIFILIQWLRQGMDNLIVDLLFDRVKAYFFGYLAAFSQWFISYDNLGLTGGLTTFAGPFNFIGIVERPLGFYEPITVALTTTTNIFTAFRGLVIDFSITGAVIFAFIIGFIAQLFFNKSQNIRIIKTLPISMFYAFTLYSPLISIFHYNSIIFSWVIAFFLILFGKDEYKNYYS
jgi:oligosaccharide repeat unit polymerase